MATNQRKKPEVEKKEITPDIKEIDKVELKNEEVKENLPVYITIEDFLDTKPAMKKAERLFYVGNHKTNDCRTAIDWEVITGLK